MYWQVYLHKTVLSAEHMMINLLKRASWLTGIGTYVPATYPLEVFLRKEIQSNDFFSPDPIIRKKALDHFANLDDSDILCAIKSWMLHADPVLANLSNDLINRKLFKIKLSKSPYSESKLSILKDLLFSKIGISVNDADFMIIHGEITNSAYDADAESINILYKNGKLKDIKEASDINLEGLTKTVRKHFVCYPREIITR
jgi:HD superfamily phosphohydrolase